jgi:REP element-mobilizing transposase RayT
LISKIGPLEKDWKIQISISTELPIKCQGCAKSEEESIHNKCSFCREIHLSEGILCHLNRSTQERSDFKCYAFQPLLKVVSSSGHEDLGSFDDTKKGAGNEPFPRWLSSDTIKYQKALALQKLNRDPEGVFEDLKYHFAWNVIYRRPVFSPPEDYLSFIGNIFFKCNELIGGFVNLIALASDHVHVYVESDGTHSVDTMIREIKRFSNNAILSNPGIKSKLDEGSEMWDVAYFSQTVG